MEIQGGQSQLRDEPGVDAREYLRIIQRRSATIVATAIVCVALAASYTVASTKSYAASTTVLVKPVVTDWANASPPTAKSVDTATEQSVAASDAVARDVIKSLQLTDTSPAQLLDKLTVAHGSGEAATLRFTYLDSNPTMARNVALGFARSYLAQRRAASVNSLTRVQRALQARIKELEAELSQLEGKRTATATTQTPTPSETIAANQISSARNTLTRLSLAEVSEGAIISEPPPADQLKSKPPTQMILAAGLLLGIVIGLIIAFLRDRLSDRFYPSAAASSRLGAQAVETIPLPRPAIMARLRGSTALQEAGNPTVTAAFGRLSEHVLAKLSRMRTTNSLIQMRNTNPLIVVTSPRQDHATSIVALRLACALAEAGPSVSLLTRLEGAALAPLNGVVAPVTLADMAERGTRVDKAQTIDELGTRLRVVPVGMLNTLRRDSTLDAIRTLRMASSVLVVDAPPLLDGADGLALAGMSDLVLLTVVAGTTRRSEIEISAEHVHAIQSPVLQAVVLARHSRGGRRRAMRRRSHMTPRLGPAASVRASRAQEDVRGKPSPSK
jgi:capsular polysaccharide biosynthesis protein